MNTLSIDIETYSGTELKTSGVYRYSEAPDFIILLFGYAVDGGSVNVIDLTSGVSIPREIIRALYDPAVTKRAFNAQFERVCLSRYLGVWLDPAGWRCSMVWAGTLGLPMSLAGAGAALGLEKQKVSEGQDLIRYFCKPCRPTKANGGRTRNRPHDAPDKWAEFVSYNRRDVEVEMDIQRSLTRYPVPESEWRNYELDQRINDRGIALDMELVHSAIRCDAETRAHTMDAARTLTGLKNPNSTQQLLAWLKENGVDTLSLDKKAVSRLLSDHSGIVRKVLEYRRELAKSSVKKYTAMEQAVCADGRAHGLIQFYGAQRTGRFCLTGEHVVLTKDGWTRLDQWEGGYIACWTPVGEMVSFQNAQSVSFDYEGAMYSYEDKRISQTSTPDHKMYVKRRYDGAWGVDTVENMRFYRPSIPFTGYNASNTGLEHAKLRVLIMVQADGHYTSDGSIMLAFKKARKIARCKELLRRAEIVYSVTAYGQKDDTVTKFAIHARHVPLWLRLFREKTFGTWLWDESADVFFDEIVYWDGYRSAKNSIQYCTCNKQNADMVQAFAHLTGRSAVIRIKDRSKQHPNWSDAYVVDIWLTPGNCHEIRCKPSISQYSGTVYCAVTRTGFFLVRRHGRVWVTGNSGRLIQVQNLPHIRAGVGFGQI